MGIQSMSVITKRKLIVIGLPVFALSIGLVTSELKVYSNTPSIVCSPAEHTIGQFVRVNGGEFVRDSQGIYPEERPSKKLKVLPFLIQATEVTNSQFLTFVKETGYQTEAEKFGGSASFTTTGHLSSPLSWWLLDENATWKSPDGLGSNLKEKENHPVVHVTLNDARAYAKWAGGRIPSEIEWEYAASLGLFDPQNPESGIKGPNGEPLANIWNGTFPIFNTEEDGFKGTAPVGCYKSNLIGAYDMIGNVWEWTESRYGAAEPMFTIKGGSYLCGSNYCKRYRTSAREKLEYNFSTAHVGFRIVKDL